jgi:hypothetical protein
MATIKTGLDHYTIVAGGDESTAVYGDPCVMVESDTGDLLFAHLDIPADDGSVRGAHGLDVSLYRLTAPTADQLEETLIEDAGPDGFDFEREDDYESPFAEEEEEDEEDEDDGSGDPEPYTLAGDDDEADAT